MPRVLIPETADAYLGTGVRPIHTGTSKRDLFETLPKLVQLGESIGNSQAVGQLANLGAAGYDKLQAISAAERAASAEVGAVDDAAKARKDAAFADQEWRDFQAQPTQANIDESAKLQVDPASTSIGRQVTGEPTALPQYPEPMNKPGPTYIGAKTRAVFAEQERFQKWKAAHPNPYPMGSEEAMRWEANVNHTEQILEDKTNAAHADDQRDYAVHKAKVQGVSEARQEIQAAAAPAPRRNVNPDLLGGTEWPLDLTPEQMDALRSRLRTELAAGGPAAVQAMVEKVRQAYAAKRSATAPLQPSDLPRQTNEGVAGTAEPGFTRASEPAVAAAQQAAPAAEVPKTYAELAAAARRADTPEKQAQVLAAAGQSGVFQPKTLFERLSGEHEHRGVRELSSLFPHAPRAQDPLAEARYKHALERDAEQARFRNAEAERKAKSMAAEHERRVAADKAKALHEKALMDQRIDEFGFEKGDKFAETKRHNRASEAVGWAQAKANVAKTDREAKNSPDLKGALGVYKDRLDTLDKDEQKSQERVQSIAQKAQAAEAAAAEAKKAAVATPAPTNRRDVEAAKVYSAAQNELRDAARAAKAARAEAATAKAQHDAQVEANKEERTRLRKRVDAIAEELSKRGSGPAPDEE